MISLFFAIAGSATIFFNDSIEHHLFLLIPAILIVMYGLLVGLSLIGAHDQVKVKKRCETISLMGFFYTLLSFAIMLYKLKILGGSVPISLALAVSFAYLVMAVTASMAGLIFHGLIRSIFMRSLPMDNEDWVSAQSA